MKPLIAAALVIGALLVGGAFPQGPLGMPSLDRGGATGATGPTGPAGLKVENIQANGATVTNTTTETVLFTYALAANEFAANGYKLKTTAQGLYTSDNINAQQINVWVGAGACPTGCTKVLTSTGAGQALNTNMNWALWLDCTATATPGAAVPLYCGGNVKAQTTVVTDSNGLYATGNTSTFSLPTNGILNVAVTAKWGGASLGESTTGLQFDSLMYH